MRALTEICVITTRENLSILRSIYSMARLYLSWRSTSVYCCEYILGLPETFSIFLVGVGSWYFVSTLRDCWYDDVVFINFPGV